MERRRTTVVRFCHHGGEKKGGGAGAGVKKKRKKATVELNCGGKKFFIEKGGFLIYHLDPHKQVKQLRSAAPLETFIRLNINTPL